MSSGDYRRPESVLVVVYTATGQALVMERADQPGLWQSVTGSLDRGESAASAARRELVEETGIEAVPTVTGISRRFDILPHWQPLFAPGTQTNLEHEFRVRLPEPVPARLSPHEHSQAEWLPLKEAAARVFSWTNRAAIEALIDG